MPFSFNNWLVFALIGFALLFAPLWGVLASIYGWLDLTTVNTDGVRTLAMSKMIPFFLATPPGILLLATAMYRYRYPARSRS